MTTKPAEAAELDLDEWSTGIPKVLVPFGGKPIKSWASSVEVGAVSQAVNLSKLPFVISHVALMPDAHQGYGMPIGGVLFADAVVVPYAIGVDIGCGVNLYQTDLTAADLNPERLKRVLDQIIRDVPVGNGPHGNQSKPQADYSSAMDSGVVHWGWAEKAAMQLGTLGGGNHFIELQADEDDRVYLMLHSGSRALGKNICDHYHKEALRLNKMWFSELPDKELAYLPAEESEVSGQYWAAMGFALNFAVENRLQMAMKSLLALQRHLSPTLQFDAVADCHHNYAVWENHGGKNGIVHRKGAVRAREGDNVLIPGSMGTPSYWAIGKGNPESFETSPHGAGRAMSRGAARKAHGLAEMELQLSEAGTYLVTRDRNEVLDEAPWAYKDIAQVMADSSSLVEINRQLRPLGTVKG